MSARIHDKIVYYQFEGMPNQEVEGLVSALRHNEFVFEQKNYTHYIQFNVFENHKTERIEEIIMLPANDMIIF